MVNARFLGAVAAVLAGLVLPATALALRLRASSRARAARARTLPADETTATRKIPVSTSSRGVAEIGPLFANSSTSLHECTASVVDSPGDDTLITAAHCVTGTGAGMVFVPGARGRQAPYGRWTVTAVHMAPEWVKRQDPHADFAFLTVAPQKIAGKLTSIEKVTGAYRLGSTAGAGARVTVTGYPGGTAVDAITCGPTTYIIGGFPAFDCRGYVGGTSGSPWVQATAEGLQIVGVIGGYKQGGCYDFTSYSAPLAAAARGAYSRAVAGATADVAPTPGGDGC